MQTQPLYQLGYISPAMYVYTCTYVSDGTGAGGVGIRTPAARIRCQKIPQEALELSGPCLSACNAQYYLRGLVV